MSARIIVEIVDASDGLHLTTTATCTPDATRKEKITAKALAKAISAVVSFAGAKTLEESK